MGGNDSAHVRSLHAKLKRSMSRHYVTVALSTTTGEAPRWRTTTNGARRHTAHPPPQNADVAGSTKALLQLTRDATFGLPRSAERSKRGSKHAVLSAGPNASTWHRPLPEKSLPVIPSRAEYSPLCVSVLRSRSSSAYAPFHGSGPRQQSHWPRSSQCWASVARSKHSCGWLQ